MPHSHLIAETGQDKKNTIPTLTMELLTLVAEKVIEFTLVPIGRQLGYLISYQSNVKELKDQFKALQNCTQVVQNRVDEARRQGEDIDARVQDWFSRVNEITELVDKLYEEETHANTNCSFKSCPNLWLRHQISRKAKKMTQEVAEIEVKADKFDKFDKFSSYKPPDLVGVPLTSSSTVIEGMESRISIRNQVLEALADPNIYMVGLCGLPGVGKTTLAKEVVRKVKEENLFDKVVWVRVGQNPDSKGIQSQIIDNVEMKLDAESVLARASHLNERLKRERNLLVVLDDLWKRLDLDEVGIPFDDNPKKKIPIVDENNKCKILLTSRHEDLLYNQMNCRRNIKMDVMSEEEALKLFKKNADLSDDSNHIDLLSMAAEVVKLCGGLPLAIVAVARPFQNKRKISEWRSALNELKRPLRRNMTGIKEVDSSLLFSYDHLDAELQSIFLLSAMLSHDPLIIDLLMYSMGLSLLQGVHSMKDAQDALDVLVSKLKASSLLLNSFSNDRFTMHDVFREFSLSIASEVQHALVVSFPMLEIMYLHEINSSITSIWDDHLPLNSFGNLKTLTVTGCGSLVKLVPLHELISLSNLEEVEVTNCESLEMVFDFDDLNSYKETQLSSSVPLKKLKLYSLPKLTHVWSNDPQHIFSFPSLQQVKAYDCETLESMFPASIAKGMLHLEELEIFNCGIDVIVAKAQVSESGAPTFVFPKLYTLQLWNLPNLKNLYGDRHTSEWPCLQHFIILDCDGLEIFGKEDSSLSSLQEESPYVKYPLFFHEKEIPNLKMLTLDAKQLAVMLRNVQLGFAPSFFNLMELNVYGSGVFGERFSLDHLRDDCFQSDLILPNLESLDVTTLELSSEMKKLWVEKLPHHKPFSKLGSLSVDNCDFLCEYVIPAHLVKCLSNLEELEVRNCYSVKAIFDVKGMELDEEARTSLPNIGLRKLKLHHLPNLKCVWTEDYDGINCFQHLQELLVCECDSLINIFVESTAKGLTQLEKLEIESCELLEVIPRLEGLTLNQKDATLLRDGQFQADLFDKVETLCLESFLEKSVSFPYSFLDRFPNLEELRVEHSCFVEILPSQSQTASFKKLYVGYLDQLKTIWDDDSQVQPIHQDLERLEVECCCSLIKLTPPLASFENLTQLIVSGCQQLIYLVTSSTAKSLVNLYRLEITDCERMEEIVRNESEEDAEATITFKLWGLELTGLTSLKSFCSENHTLEFPELEGVTITECHQMKMFCPGVVETPELWRVEIDGDISSLKGDLNNTIEFLLLNKDGTNMYKED
ncbi:putative disease resistance protein [Senna tora]|uniref:Putative disease resistance protein n=1 Tax=Senna tora TaxID=362788 RepID=A0A834XAC6_9FABA|nr:putative disease resistance protein [Senna tora]